jgi:hypothetical protein
VDDPGWSTGCSFFDVDGDLDLYVAHYVKAAWEDVFRAQRTYVWRPAIGQGLRKKKKRIGQELGSPFRPWANLCVVADALASTRASCCRS